MNGWNDFQYNMAAGAGACGAGYWLVPGANSGMVEKIRSGNPTPPCRKGQVPCRNDAPEIIPWKLLHNGPVNSFNTVGADG